MKYSCRIFGSYWNIWEKSTRYKTSIGVYRIKTKYIRPLNKFLLIFPENYWFNLESSIIRHLKYGPLVVFFSSFCSIWIPRRKNQTSWLNRYYYYYNFLVHKYQVNLTKDPFSMIVINYIPNSAIKIRLLSVKR